jgi:hypothetical protein
MSKDIGANANNHHLNNTAPFECFTWLDDKISH